MNYKLKLPFLLALVGMVSFWSCVQDDEFSLPPIECNNAFEATHTIPQMFGFNTTQGPTEITDSVIFEGYVISSDDAGNFFSTLVLQDSLQNPTRGLQVEISVQDLYTRFPVGTRVLINATGLYIDDDTGTLEVGAIFNGNNGPSVGRIAEVDFNDHVFRTCDDVAEVTPKVYTNIADAIAPQNLNTLIRIEGVQFANVCNDATYYDENNDLGNATNVTLMDQEGNTIAVRNSAFATFANDLLPTGSGSITGVLSAFDTNGSLTNSDYQIFIRDTNDVAFDNERFETFGTPMTIQELRDMFTGSAMDLDFTENRFIEGSVISDRSNGSMVNSNMVLQDDTAGITVRFTDDTPYNLHQNVKILLNGAELSEFNGLLQVNNVEPENSESDCGETVVEPTVVTVADVLTGDYESQLVQINMAEFENGGTETFAGNQNLDDGTGTVAMFTRNSFELSQLDLPAGPTDIIAIASTFNGAQLLPRDIEEVGAVLPLFRESFNNGIPSNWQTFTNVEGVEWEGTGFSGVSYARMSAFAGSGNPIHDVEAWLITPAIDFDGQEGEEMVLNIGDAFSNGQPLKAYYSTDYDGTSEPSTATWTEIGATEINALNQNPDFYDNIYEATAPIDLSGVAGTGYVAFVYNSEGGTISTTVDLSTVTINTP